MVVRQEVKKVCRRDQLCVVIHHDDFKTSSDDFVELYAVKHYLKVTEEGSPDYFFDHPNTELADEEGAPQALPQVVEDTLNGQSNEANMLEALRGVVDIDDNNNPAPENIPAPTDNNDEYSTQSGCIMATASDNQPTWPITRPVLIFVWIQQEMTTSYSFSRDCF